MKRKIGLVLMIVGILTWADQARADAPATQPTVRFLTMGDWGNGSPNQVKVAQALARIGSQGSPAPTAVLLAGDNITVPAASVDDPVWSQLFEQMYDSKLLPMPFYASLGNHDYEGDKRNIELAYTKAHPGTRWRMPGMWYRVDFPADHPVVSMLVLDSYRDGMTTKEWTDQLGWLETELAKPRGGAWMIALAHHPLFSNGSHGDTGPLQTSWGVLFKKYNLDFYICGHDHDLQHLQLPDWSTTFMVVGGGGRPTTVMRRDDRGPFSRSLHGFADVDFTTQLADVSYYDEDGNLVHHFQRTRDGTVSVLFTTGKDSRTKNPLKAIETGQ